MESKTFEFADRKIVLTHVVCFGAQGDSPNIEVFIEFLNGKIIKEGRMNNAKSAVRIAEIDRAINNKPWSF